MSWNKMPSLGQFGIERIESLMCRRRGSSAGGITVMWYGGDATGLGSGRLLVRLLLFRIWRRCRDLREPLLFFLSPGENVRSQNSSIYVSKRVDLNAFSTHMRRTCPSG